MADNIDEAIFARWDAKSLDTTFPGGLWPDEADENATWPYVVLFTFEEFTGTWTSTSEIGVIPIQFSVWYQEVASVDPKKRMRTLLDTLQAAYDWAPLLVTGNTITEVRRTLRRIERDVSDGVWHGILRYNIRMSESVNYSPS